MPIRTMFDAWEICANSVIRLNSHPVHTHAQVYKAPVANWFHQKYRPGEDVGPTALDDAAGMTESHV